MKAFIEQIRTPAAVRPVMVRAFEHATAAANEGEFEVVIRKATKSREQEQHYHALIGDIASQYDHAGRRWDAEDMKRILVDAFKHETKDDPEFAQLWRDMGDLRLVPAIGRDGFVPLGEQTRRFPKKLACAFITWLQAFMAENHIACTDPKWASYEQMGRAA